MLELPEWLVERAAHDDPATTIDAELVVRLHRAGVDRLVPSDGAAALDAEDAGRATAIGAIGPGFGFAESFENEPAPVLGALVRLRDFLEPFDEPRRFRLAGIDMRIVEAAARALRERDGPARMFERVLETGLFAVYARPYLGSNETGGVAGLKGRWEPQGADAELHEQVMQLRGSYHAHAERSRHRTLTDTAAELGVGGPPTYAEAWYRLTDRELERIEDLARRQAERFEAEALTRGAALGERRDEHLGIYYGEGDRRARPRGEGPLEAPGTSS
jgi:hypothetical protein